MAPMTCFLLCDSTFLSTLHCMLIDLDRGELIDARIIGIGQAADAGADIACLCDPALLVGGEFGLVDGIGACEHPTVKTLRVLSGVPKGWALYKSFSRHG